MRELIKHIMEADIFQPADPEEAKKRVFSLGKLWVSLRTVRAKNYAEAVTKVENNDFDENCDICDAIVAASSLRIDGMRIDEDKNIFKAAPEEEAQARMAAVKARREKLEKEYWEKLGREPYTCPHCKVDLRTAGVDELSKEYRVDRLIFHNGYWEANDGETYDSETTGHECAKCQNNISRDDFNPRIEG